MTVSERNLTVTELTRTRKLNQGVEARLSGTAAVLTPIGTFIYPHDKEYTVAQVKRPTTQKLRQALNDIPWGNTWYRMVG